MKAIALLVIGVFAMTYLVTAVTICPDGQWMKSDNTCQPCLANCKKCNAIDDQPNCIECEKGLTLDLSGAVGTCFKCIEGCKTCTSPKTEDCLEEAEGYGRKINTNDLIKCPRTCYYCSEENKCSNCHYGYFVDNGDCVKCPENCVECKKENEKSTCTICNVGYTVGADGTCTHCPEGCEECSLTGCKVCIPNYGLNGGKCQRCPQGCLECDSSGKCTKCYPGYGLNNGKAQNCEEINYLCKECYNGRCNACVAQYRGNSVTFADNNCYACSDNCLRCNLNECLECAKNSQKVGNACKKTDILNCVEIDGQVDKCKKCAAGFRLKNEGKECETITCGADGFGKDGEGNCVPCPMTNCRTCDMKDKVCVFAIAGHYVDVSVVKPCRKGCGLCHKNGDAIVCDTIANSVNQKDTVLKINDKTGEAGYTCDASCGACKNSGDPQNCAGCRPGKIGVLSYDVRNPLKPEEIHSYCIDSTAQCPRPSILFNTDVCLEVKSAQTLIMSLLACLAAILFA